MRSPSRFQRPARGFTLPELMIASTIGLLILAGMASIFVSSTRTQAEIEKANRQIENGRFAVQLISGDIFNAGYYGQFDPSPLASPIALPSACDTELADLRLALPLPVQGVDDALVASAGLDCLDGIKEGSDVLVVRRVQTCVAGAGTCAPTSAGGALFQASLCLDGDELASADSADFYDLDTLASGLTRTRRDCTTAAEIRRFVTHIYYISANGTGADAIPTLQRAELGGTDNVLGFTVVPMVEGIEDMQLEYGIDTNADGVPDLFNADPATANGCMLPACQISNWRAVVSVKLHLLARNLEPSRGHTDSKTYTLGLNAAGENNTVEAAGDGFKRHVFQSMMVVPNTAGRRTP